jgi:pimeloyl-ACP methyl ester carboxylesterase
MLATRMETLRSGRRLRVARLGAGPPLVLCHGYPDNLQIWCALAPRLAEHFSVIAFDWPGLGQSELWPGGTTPMHQGDRLATLLDEWQLDRAGVVGLDMGGQPALALAAQHPERVRQLVVMNSLVMWDEKTSWEIGLLRRFGFNRFALGRLPRVVFRRAERSFLPRGTSLDPELRADLWEAFSRPEVRAFLVRMCAGYQGTLPRLAALYPRVRCPTHIVWGAKDAHFPVVHAERLARLIPGARLTVLAAGHHWMPWHLAEATCAAILAGGTG